jgi:phosphatidylcholine synthase
LFLKNLLIVSLQIPTKKDYLLKIKAYGVHAFTALGAALGLLAIILSFQGRFHGAIWALLAAGLIDSVDGSLARAVHIGEHAPRINGALMDNIIDFLTWTIAPLFWIYAIMQVPAWVVMICAFASIFGFTNIQAKSDDDFFTGFPSFWNLVVFFIYLLHFSTFWASLTLLCFAAATFLPLKFIYPSKTKLFQTLTLVLGVLYALQLLALIVLFDRSPRWLIYFSFIFPVYYFVTSFYLQWKLEAGS